MICLEYIKLKKTHGNWTCIDTDFKIMYTPYTLHISISLVTMLIILSNVYFQYQIDFILLSVLYVCHVLFSVCCSFVVTCWERADLLALLCVMFCYVLLLSHVVF